MSDKNPLVHYCDNHLLVAIKPQGVPTQPHEGSSGSLEESVKAWVKEEFKKPGNVFLHVIHRLDKPVGGLVLFARTSKALSRLNEASRKKEIERSYLAIVEGVLLNQKGKLEHHLHHGDHRAVVDAKGKYASLTYKVIEKRSHSTVVSVKLDTGRYHQIRAQFAAIGHPILGDKKYGSSKGDGIQIALWCNQISFQHPILQKRMDFSFAPNNQSLKDC